LKVIYASGYSAEIVGKDFRLKDGVNFLTRPFQAQKLTETIRKHLGKRTQAESERFGLDFGRSLKKTALSKNSHLLVRWLGDDNS
jgi:two-component SAPR family response regulator